MATLGKRNGSLPVLAAIALGTVLFAVLVGPATGPGLASAAAAGVAPATGNTSSAWAYGGSAFNSTSCSSSDPSCLGFNLTSNNSTFSIAWKYYVGWVVIVNATNVSPTQTEISTKAAINISASYSYTVCTPLAPSGPCAAMSVHVTLGGLWTAHGSTNLTNGTVTVTTGPDSPGTLAAVAITNASAGESLNLSGTLALSTPNVTATGSFDLGGSASSSVSFGSPLGIVPFAPRAGDGWTSSAPFSASGSFVHGYSYSVSAAGYPAQSSSNWSRTNVSPSGILNVSGSDEGVATLWDNYTSPHGTLSVDHVHLLFPGDDLAGTDGWIVSPAGFSGAFSGLLGGSNSTPAATSGEELYYVPGAGFVGARLSGNASNVSLAPGAPNATIEAGPEPVGVAEQQYAAMTAGPVPAAFPYVLLAVIAVAAAGIAAAVLVLHRRAGRRPPPAGPSTPSAGTGGVPPTPPIAP